MIEALRALRDMQAGLLPKEIAASEIAGGGLVNLVSSHPPIGKRIAALQSRT
jgi:heat shock protein HtpX